MGPLHCRDFLCDLVTFGQCTKSTMLFPNDLRLNTFCIIWAWLVISQGRTEKINLIWSSGDNLMFGPLPGG